jgi:hypothetical protein
MTCCDPLAAECSLRKQQFPRREPVPSCIAPVDLDVPIGRCFGSLTAAKPALKAG